MLSKGLNLIKNPENIALLIVSKQVDEIPISSIVSEVRVKKISPLITE
jgi:hypothetical protein